jgi:hypothetical protein
MSFSEPADGKFGDVKDGEFIGMLKGEGIYDGAGGVGGTIVDGKDLEVGVMLVEKGLETRRYFFSFISCGNYDGEGWVSCGVQVILRLDEIWNAT